MAEETPKINIEAEKTIFNDALVGSGTYRDMMPDTTVVPKIEMPATEFSSLPNEKPMFSMNETISGAGQEYSKFTSENMAPTATVQNNFTNELISSSDNTVDTIRANFSPTNSVQSDNILNAMPAVDSLTNSKLLRSQAFTPGLEDVKTKKIEDRINSQIMPSLKNLASKINDLNVGNKNQNSLVEQRPTNPASNLIFDDRSKKASEAPYWS